MRDLVQGDPQTEVARRHMHAAFGLDDVGSDVVQAPGPVAGQHEVVLPQDLLRKVPEEHSDLNPDGGAGEAPSDRRERHRLTHAFGHRSQERAETVQVRPGPSRSVQQQRPGIRRRGLQAGEVPNESVR